VIHFAHNFTESFADVRDNLSRASEGSFKNRDINVYLDTTDQRLTLMLNRKLYNVFDELGQELSRACKLPLKLWTIP
jgi:hypothetical protein